MLRKCIITAVVVLSANLAFAQGAAPAAEEEEGPWSGKASLGFLSK